MNRRITKILLWVFLTPLCLFTVLMIALYIPAVQNLIRQQATEYASQATGMQIKIERIDLRFPLNLLVRGVEVKKKGEEVLNLSSLNAHIRAIPLFRGEVEVDNITLRRARVNSMDLIKGVQLKGLLGQFTLESHSVDLVREYAKINKVELNNAHFRVLLNDTTETPEDTTSQMAWRILLDKVKMRNVSFRLALPTDSTQLFAKVGNGTLEDAAVDLKHSAYGFRHLQLVDGAMNYDKGQAAPALGMDFSHIAWKEILVEADSVHMAGRSISATIREMSAKERSGLSVSSLQGRFWADSVKLEVPTLTLKTPYSQIVMKAHTYWQLVDKPTESELFASLYARLGRQDVMTFVGGLPDSFKENYPQQDLTIQTFVKGNLSALTVGEISAELPTAFKMEGGGVLRSLTDTVKREAHLELKAETYDMDFLTTLGGKTPNGAMAIPEGTTLSLKADMLGTHYGGEVHLQEGGVSLGSNKGMLHLVAGYDTRTESYQLEAEIDSLNMHHFLPKDSLFYLSATASVQGKGTDFYSRKATSSVDLFVEGARYARHNLSNIHLDASLHNSLLKANFYSHNALLDMTVDAEYRLSKRPYTEGRFNVDVRQLELYRLGVAPHPLKHPFAFQSDGYANERGVVFNLRAGDASFTLKAGNTLEDLMKRSTHYAELLQKQFTEKALNHAELRKALPTMAFSLKVGKENPFARFVETYNFHFDEARCEYGAKPSWGLNGHTIIRGLSRDSIQLDTIRLVTQQDTTHMRLTGYVINVNKDTKKNFHLTMDGDVRSEDAELLFTFKDYQNKLGLLFGLQARPLGDGISVHFIPEEPVIAFRKFRFNKDNHVMVHANGSVVANVEMLDNTGQGFLVHSMPDSIALQNLDIELRRIKLDEISRLLPLYPPFAGMFSAEAHYRETKLAKQISTELTMQHLSVYRQPLGDIALGLAWLPDEKQNTHYVNGYLTRNGEEILLADGSYHGQKDSLQVHTTMEHFPMLFVNAFIPKEMAVFTGDIDGELSVSGSSKRPLMNGELQLDQVTVSSKMAGVNYRFDNRKVQIQNSRAVFDQYAIYTTGKNPFLIDGFVDFRKLESPNAKLTLKAKNYTLLDAPRNRESLLYGKAYVDMNAIVMGPLDNLVMRGSMNLRGGTDLTYVMLDSPLTVEDRLGELVTFSEFADSLSSAEKEEAKLSLGGLDMIMTLHVDPAVRLKADLSADRSSRIELEGGGDLSLQYTPRGDMTLTGRYTLNGGMMKYALPVIPLKEFQIKKGSYVDWTGNMMDPTLNFVATEHVRSSVSQEGGGSRVVGFDISVSLKNKLENLNLAFDMSAPDDTRTQNELAAMSGEERSKQAITLLATGIYTGGSGGGGNLDMGSALNSVLQSQVNTLFGAMSTSANINFGMDSSDGTDGRGKRTDYSFSYTQRFFNDRFQINLGGTISSGNTAGQEQAFIDNASLEYRLDSSGSHYVRLFYDKNYDSLFEGEITQTGVGLVMRKKMNRLGELFIFRKKEISDEPTPVKSKKERKKAQKQ